MSSKSWAASRQDAATSERGAVVAAGAPLAAQAGHRMLRQGGNAIDAAVTAALCAGVVEPASCGIAGYGAHLTIALANGKVTCIDANSAAPQRARPDMFQADAHGQVAGKSNYYGWSAAGVPGVLAGLQLALDRYGQKNFTDAVQPAIQYADQGFEVPERLAIWLQRAARHLSQDQGSQRLYFPNGKPLRVGSNCRNPSLAELLEKLATRGTADSFYRGDIAREMAAQFQQQGSIVTSEDLAAYRAQEVVPVELEWRGCTVHTAPLTAGGASTLQALSILKALNWQQLADQRERSQATLEALRLAWQDRFRHFGDPNHVEVPMERLLSNAYAEQLAAQVRESVKQRRPLEIELDSYDQNGTVHISAGDSQGNLAALTLTHGGAFGARVTVDRFGLTLGHGISRFDPRPGFANSIEAGKRPLNNMTPTVVLRGGRPALAVGGRGGRRIPNALCSVLLGFVAEGRSMAEAVDSPRMHTEGSLTLTLDAAWSDSAADAMSQLGYEVVRGDVAKLSAVSVDLATGSTSAAHR